MSFFLLGMMVPVQAEIILEEDFSDPISDGWEFKGFNDTDGIVTEVPSQILVENEELVYLGDTVINTTDVAYHAASFTEGTISVDWYKTDQNNFFSLGFANRFDQFGLAIDELEWANLFFDIYYDEALDLVACDFGANNETEELFRYKRLSGFQVLNESMAWYHIDITISNNDYKYYINGSEVFTIQVKENLGIDLEYFYFWSNMGEGIKFDNLVITSEVITYGGDAGVPGFELLIVGTALLMTGFVVWKTSKKKLANYFKMRRRARSTKILQSLSEVLNTKQLYYLSILGTSKVTDPLRKPPDSLPLQMRKYRYLFQPTRLAILKLLYKNFSMSSTDIKDALDISWGEYTTHINSLKEKGYIDVQKEFEEGMQRQVVYLEEHGRQEYELFIRNLKEFLRDATFQEYILKSEKEMYPRTDT